MRLFFNTLNRINFLFFIVKIFSVILSARDMNQRYIACITCLNSMKYFNEDMPLWLIA